VAIEKGIELTVNRLVESIESRVNSREAALQFVLEELDAARMGNDFVRDKIKSLYFLESEYVGAMDRSRADVDSGSGTRQILLRFSSELSLLYGVDFAGAVRISIVEYVARHFQLGRYHVTREANSARKPMNLFGVSVYDESRLHPHFKHLLEPSNKPVRDVISRWASGFEDRDNKFIREFQTTFNSSFWELYLYQCFKDFGMPVDFSKAAADFTAQIEEGVIVNIEAVSANHAHNSPPEWAVAELKSDSDFLNFSCIRILSSINAKHKKFVEAYSKLAHVKNRPFIIAVAPFEQPMFFMQNNEAIIRVLYGKGIDKNNGFREVETPFAFKNGHAVLDLGIFTSNKYKEVSAIIFSTTATIGKAIAQSSLRRTVRCSRYHESRGLIVEIIPNAEHFETHLDGLQVHHNPYAENRLSTEAFKKYEVTHYHYDVESKVIDNQQKSYTIISRTIFSSSSLKFSSN
jgi:hypothetical protein